MRSIRTASYGLILFIAQSCSGEAGVPESNEIVLLESLPEANECDALMNVTIGLDCYRELLSPYEWEIVINQEPDPFYDATLRLS